MLENGFFTSDEEIVLRQLLHHPRSVGNPVVAALGYESVCVPLAPHPSCSVRPATPLPVE